jgi:anthranilate synthase/aminodeoxychorismate synthase-like glutamine amidotransferase
MPGANVRATGTGNPEPAEAVAPRAARPVTLKLPTSARPPMLLLIDNYDSFTWNLVQRFGEVAPELAVEVHRNDQITADEIAAKAPSHLVVSPGPCTPDEAGISCDVVRRFAGRMPLLGVCLGHQSIGQVFGGRIVRAGRLMHGKVDSIEHTGRGLFAGLASPIEATRYHSLVIDPPTLPREFDIDAWSTAPDGTREIMAIRHKTLPVYGVQFHPESFLTPVGHDLLRAFLATGPVAA